MKKECGPDKILNKETNRCVLKTGKIGKKILGIKEKECGPEKILNKETNRCVSKTGKIGKKILEKKSPKISPILSSNSSFNINIKNENASCYLDSLLVALFHSKNKDIYNMFFKTTPNYFNNNNLKKTGETIQNELKNIYNYIRYDKDATTKYCSLFRQLLEKYYNTLISLDKTKQIFFTPSKNSKSDSSKILEEKDNWLNKQIDVLELLSFLGLIFNFSNAITYNKILEGSNLYYSNFILQLSLSDYLNKKTIDLNDYYPIKKERYELDNDNLFISSIGKKSKYYEKITEILKSSSFIFIALYRNDVDGNKLFTKIEFPMTIKLKENSEDLYIKSLIIHKGSSKYGHYIALLYKNNEWYEYDDMTGVKKINPTKKKWSEYKKNIVGIVYSYN